LVSQSPVKGDENILSDILQINSKFPDLGGWVHTSSIDPLPAIGSRHQRRQTRSGLRRQASIKDFIGSMGRFMTIIGVIGFTGLIKKDA